VDNPCKGKTYPPETLTESEVHGLIKSCSRRAPTGRRNAAAIVLMYRSGLRVGEVLALKPKDVDVDSGVVRVLHGKGDRSRVVAIDPGSMAIIVRWMEWRSRHGIRPPSPLICTLRGRYVGQHYIRQMLGRMRTRAGIEKRVHPHGLRHTFAAELAAEGTPINVIQRALGHSNAATTGRYLNHVAPEDVIRVLRNRSWPEKVAGP
jgi:site-specific recombinase XerD